MSRNVQRHREGSQETPNIYRLVTFQTHGSGKIEGMKAMEQQALGEPRAKKLPQSGLTPLPQRWRRAQLWGSRYGFSTFDMATMKLILEAEAVRKG